MMKGSLLACILFIFQYTTSQEPTSFIRINQLGYLKNASKVAVMGTFAEAKKNSFELIDATNNKVVYTGKASNSYGAYGPFTNSYRLNFSSYEKSGRYYLRMDEVRSPVFHIGNNVYDNTADFCLRYMRQQRSGFNPFLNDSCHTRDGYTLYAPVPDSSFIDVTGGWHDASDYLQYSSTSANAAYHLLAAYRDFPHVFKDTRRENGTEGSNNVADVLDEAKWGLTWLLKMHPREDWMFNQLGDDRDHRGMRIPKEDTNYYGRGIERPVYFCTGEPQVRGKFMNNTTGVASTAGKFAAAFALGSHMFAKADPHYSRLLQSKSESAIKFGLAKPGACQTASVLSPYIYAEDNWRDDMQLGAAMLAHNNDEKFIEIAWEQARAEPITPWLGADTAKHYQWYPFINAGHYELAKLVNDGRRDSLIGYYREGIERVYAKAKSNAFLRGIPFIWCSNNLTVSFAIQCYWYRKLSGDNSFIELEQACIDWIFGTNPWGTSMVYGLPSKGDTPVDPHSAFTHLKNYPIDGGLVDGPVYTTIYKNLIGIKLFDEDEYAPFQSELAVYHDDYGDYSTNEPTMDGTASLIYLLAAMQSEQQPGSKRKNLKHEKQSKH